MAQKQLSYYRYSVAGGDKGKQNRIMAATDPVRFDSYVIDVLMRDLIGHDKQPSAFLVYLLLHARSNAGETAPSLSLRDIAESTGLSKSVVQLALRTLIRRKLIAAKAAHRTAMRSYRVFRPWRRR